jgi:hypothetical protein
LHLQCVSTKTDRLPALQGMQNFNNGNRIQ